MEKIKMRMASIVIPDASDEGHIFVSIQRNVVEIFIEEFGGATLYDCFGFWSKSQRQIACSKIDVAFHNTHENIHKFMGVVQMVANECAECGVHSIMAVMPDGVIIFVEGDLYDGTKNI